MARRKTVTGLILVLAVCGAGAPWAEAASNTDVPPLPDGIKGFRGMLVGTVVSKADKTFVLKVEKITRVWKGNKAENPKCVEGKLVLLDLWPKSRLAKKHLEALAGLNAGDRVLVEPFHFGGDRLSVVEELRKEEPCNLPEGIRGFRGMMLGTVVSKADKTFVLKVEKITKVWKENKAENPKCVEGKNLTIDIWPKSRLADKNLKTLAGLKAGDRVLVEPFHFGGDHLSVVEELRKKD